MIGLHEVSRSTVTRGNSVFCCGAVEAFADASEQLRKYVSRFFTSLSSSGKENNVAASVRSSLSDNKP